MDFKYSRYIIATLLAAMLTSFTAVRAAAIDGLPPGTEEALEDLQATMYPPMVYDVEMRPDPAWAGINTEVTAVIKNDSSITDDDTFEAYLMYSIDFGETWEEVEMEEEKGSLWKGSIPAQEKGTEVLYGFRAVDTSSNVYTETPCLVMEWPPENDSCMFPLSVDESPVDDEDNLIPKDFDLISLKGGMDEDYIYIEVEVEGNISVGTVSPVYVHLYGFGLLNPDRGNPADIVSQGFLGVYAPGATSFNYQECMTIEDRADEIFTDYRHIDCETNGGSKLWFRVSLDKIGDTPSDHIKLLFADGAVTSITPLAGMPYDYSHVSTISFIERWFTID